MLAKKSLILFGAIALLSFKFADKKLFEFSYPKRNGTAITLSADHFKKFSKEWRGTDYYYYAEADGFICSVLYYKLEDSEKLELVDAPKAAIGGPAISPAYPYAYFKNYSNLKSMERNDSSWGKPTDDFMFRQNNVVIEGSGFSQKHMYGYAMVGKDIFVNVHLSKITCSASDSTEMIDMLKSLIIKK
ncbi:MAG: hypothetical protein ACXVJG_05535 [Mucilaginibacter sp.]